METPRLAFFIVIASLSVSATFGRHYKDPCHGYYCANGGVCIPENDYEYRHRLSQPTCQCAGAWTGERCDDNPCNNVSCNGGNCYADGNGFAHCCCPTGTTGQFCEIEENPCDTVECNSGTCIVNEDGSTSCSCPENYSGDFCENAETCVGEDRICTNSCGPNERAGTCLDGDICCIVD